jgi:glycosyltransferase involved in cell wall biosynthesis
MKIPFLIWVHGYEVIGWYRRLYNWNVLSPLLVKHAIHNFRQQYVFRKFIKYANRFGNIKFVFVSDWMKRIAEYDTLTSIRNYSIIPNPIDTELFKYAEKSEDKRLRVLLLRSFESRKYANDISVEAIKELSKRKIFKEFSFKLIGVHGDMFEKTVEPLNGFDNVNALRQSIPQHLIPGIHADYGVFLCPTRQDSQGVSMCEAMSSGLVPITSNSTAIPEFVEDRKQGLLTNSATEIADALEFLYNDSKEFSRLSREASERIRLKCGLNQVITAELREIEA